MEARMCRTRITTRSNVDLFLLFCRQGAGATIRSAMLLPGTVPNVTSRLVALVSSSVFDAVNGIEPRFRPLQVRPDAPHHASQGAAAIHAAYAILLHLYT